METNRSDLWYCSGCGYFFDTAEDKIFDIAYTEMSADFALKVMSDRQNRIRACHMKHRRYLRLLKK